VKAALYARVSTVDKDQDPENQLRILRDYAERRGWSISKEYVDKASGKTTRRANYIEMVKDAKKREFDILLVLRTDRLGRSLRDLVILFEELRALGIDIVASDTNVDTTTPQGKAWFQMSGVFAELERALISERTKEGLARVRASGRRLGRPPRWREVLELRTLGFSHRQIGERLGISRRAVQHRIRRARLRKGGQNSP
jgi:DNA invertase Pin-like site-specific DNA recombinase